MNDEGKRYWVNHEAEQRARHVMGVVLVVVMACALVVALTLPMLYTLLCNTKGC